MANDEVQWDNLEPTPEITDSTEFAALEPTVEGGVRRLKKFDGSAIRSWLESATRTITGIWSFINGLSLTSGRIAMQEKTSGTLVASGWYQVAKTDITSYPTNIADFHFEQVGNGRNGTFSAHVEFSGSASARTYTNTAIKINGLSSANPSTLSGITGIRLAKSDSVPNAGAYVEVYVNVNPTYSVNFIAQIFGNLGNSKGFQLMTPVASTGLCPDGVTTATFLEAGAEFRSQNGGASNPSTLKFAKIDNNSIRLSFNWNEIPKQGTGISLSYSALAVYEYTTVLQSYVFDGSETIGAPIINGCEVLVTITKSSAFTNFSYAGNTVRANALIATLT